MDGTNASDAEDDRPGMRALRELCVYSPLASVVLQTEIEDVQKKQGLFTWISRFMPAWQTRIPTNERASPVKA